MELMDFFDAVEAHADLTGLGIDSSNESQPAVVVKYAGGNLITRIAIDTVMNEDWKILEEVLLGKREPQVLQHMTRVVGYYSRVENWNKSKIGELKDRQAGNYAMEAAAVQ